jgi:hypothetical protein
MKKQRSLGLDELMIVNPGAPGAEIFLGDDGGVYQVQGLAAKPDAAGLGEFFLGDDGRLYQVHGLAGAGRLPRYFLGEDGTLYELRSGR